MMRSTLVGLILVCAICSYCGKNFELLGRHQWRCKQKIHHVENVEEFPFLKKGINLPQCNIEWSTANEYFKFALNFNPPISSQDISSSIVLLNDVIYNYFADNFGHVESPPDKLLVEKYKNHTTKELRKHSNILNQQILISLK